MHKRKKIFILDTNVILHDSSCIYNFDEHWSLNAGVSWVPLSSTATFSSNVPSLGPYAGGTYTTTGKLNITPFDFTLKIGYRF